MFNIFLEISFYLMFWVDLNILSQKLENSSSVAGEIRGHSFMTSTGKGKWDHRIFADFVKDWGWSWDTVVWPCWTSICTWSKSFFLWYLESTLNFFACQLFYCFLETCLICSPAMKRLEVRKNFMRFGSSTCTCFLIMLFYLWDSSTLRACYLSISISLWKLFF